MGGGEAGFSPEMSFTTPPAAGTYPLRLGLIGDLGQTRNSEATVAHAQASEPDVVLLVGDLVGSCLQCPAQPACRAVAPAAMPCSSSRLLRCPAPHHACCNALRLITPAPPASTAGPSSAPGTAQDSLLRMAAEGAAYCGCPAQSYADDFQPRWDSYRRLVQPLASTVPVLVVEGNHGGRQQALAAACPTCSTGCTERLPDPSLV